MTQLFIHPDVGKYTRALVHYVIEQLVAHPHTEIHIFIYTKKKPITYKHYITFGKQTLVNYYPLFSAVELTTKSPAGSQPSPSKRDQCWQIPAGRDPFSSKLIQFANVRPFATRL